MNLKILTLLGTLCMTTVTSIPAVSDSSSLVISTTEAQKEETSEKSKEEGPILPKIYEMRVDTNVSNRFAKSLITSKVRNLAKSAQEATFAVVIPEQAYISGFTMEIDGKSYEAYVQEKEAAEKTYIKAVESGQAAGHVAVSARDSNRFTVSVNIEPQSKATFYLRYEELLPRQNEKYEVVINIHPGQPVKQLDVEVHINESRPIKFVKTPSLRSGNEISKNDDKLNPLAVIDIVNKTSAIVKFSPNLERQKELANNLGTNEENGLSGQFIVEYDVERDPHGGEVLVDGGYFVHFFAPSDLPALPKQVVFVLDTSGSMTGIRITQLIEAMKSILTELKPEDVFNIVEFSSIIKVWNVENVSVDYESAEPWSYGTEDPEAAFKNKLEKPLPPAYAATEENIKKAEQVVSKLQAYGGTDINNALKIGIQLVDKNLKEDKKHQPLIVFLTDGEATVGETNNDNIIKTITELNSGKAPIISLSFGDGADRNFLQKISLKNLGFARHIYEGADASLQLQEFYRQISSPLLSNVTFKYVSNVAEVTKTEFPILFYGSEIVVSGQIDPGFSPPAVEGWGINGIVKLVPVVEKSVGPLERLWAYLTLKQRLQQRDASENKTGATKEALKIALKYSFVSDVSSLVVVKPNATNAVETEDASSNDKRYPIIASGIPLSIGAAQGGSAYSSQSFPAAAPPSFALFAGPPGGFGGGYVPALTAPADFYPSTPLASTTFSPKEFITETDQTDLDIIKSRLPWLTSILNENETITISSGIYDLGLNETVSSNPDCPNTVLNTSGICRLLNKCPQVHSQLPDVKEYEKYFCELEGFAGVCCPEGKTTN